MLSKWVYKIVHWMKTQLKFKEVLPEEDIAVKV